MTTTTRSGLIRPPRLRPGDRLAAVTLSWGGPGTFPERYAAGKRQLEEAFDVEVVEMPMTLAPAEAVEDDPGGRAADLHAALVDPSIAGIVSTIGGDDSIRLLPHLDLDLIAANPKVFLGYSDSTVTHMAFRRAGVVSFYGASIMAGFGENAGLHDYLVEGVRRVLFEPEPAIAWPPNLEGWTVEQPDWGDPTLQSRPRSLTPSQGWRWHGGRAAEGPAVVGCVEVLDWLRGTPVWPDLDGAVLMLETSEEAPPPADLTSFLRTLVPNGDLHRLAGLVLGRPGGADLPLDAHASYDAALLRVVRDEEGLDDLPVVTGVDFGHTDPMWTLPVGVAVHLDPDAQRLTFMESGVS